MTKRECPNCGKKVEAHNRVSGQQKDFRTGIKQDIDVELYECSNCGKKFAY